MNGVFDINNAHTENTLGYCMNKIGNKTETPKKYVVGYVRTAVFSDGKDIVKQIAKIAEMAKRRAGFNIEHIYIDNGCSGLNTNNPQMRSLMRDMKKGRIKEVYTSNPSRISRNLESYSEFVELAKKNEVRVVDRVDDCPKRGYDYSGCAKMPIL